MKFGLSESDYQTFERIVVEPLKAAHFKLYVFGSRATQSQHPFSDLDLLLEYNHPTSESLRKLSEVKEKIEEARFPIKVDFVLLQYLAESYRTRVMSERIEI